MSTVFSLSSLLVMPVWALMVLLPRWRWSVRIVGSPWSVAPAAALYALLVLPRIGELLPALAQPTLPGIAALLGSEAGATIAWAHFLAFDLFVGRWVYLDARERGVSPWIVSPLLLVVIMFGPLGLLAYLAVRSVPRTGWAARRMGEAMAVNRPLALVAAAMAAMLVVMAAGVLLDPREVTGAPVWLKPAKFTMSFAIYGFTLLWLLGRVRGRARLVWWTATLTAVAIVVEWGVIAGQAFRGVTSHFNVGTPLDAALFATMGAFVIVLWGMTVATAVLLLAQREQDRAFAWSLRLGVLVTVLGGAMAGAMLPPTPEQVARMERGEAPTSVGAHSVGVADGGPGVPVVGWSTEGGDVRAPHFFGLHALQLIPLVGWWLSRRRRLREGERLALVWTAGLGYLGFVLVLFWQALRGEPIVAPGAATVAALTAVAAAVTASVAVVLLRARATKEALPVSGERLDGAKRERARV